MSHFSVMVITPKKPSEDDLRAILRPWHEYECTGIHDEYVIEVDKTDEALVEFNKSRRVVVLADSTVVSRWSDTLYTGPEDDSFTKRKTFELPPGATEREMPADEARTHGIGYATIEDCASEYFGASVRDGRVYNLTNPNKKWDWWQVGGRYTGLFTPNYDPDTDPENIETCWLCAGTGHREDMVCENGCNGCRGTGKSVKWPTQWRAMGSQVRKVDLPLEDLRTAGGLRAVAAWRKWRAVVADRPLPDWDKLREALGDINLARELFNNCPAVVDLRKAGCDSWSYDLGDLLLTQEQVSAQARARAVCTYAFVRDGKWYQRGEMGWFGCSNDEVDRADWDAQFGRMLDELAPSDWLTVVDCHI